MKKQNANQLAFNKAAVTELNENQMKNLNGGTGVLTPFITSYFPIPIPSPEPTPKPSTRSRILD